MKKTKITAPSYEPGRCQENCFPGIITEGFSGNGLWMEFEDSYIQILSGAEPVVEYSSNIENQQQIAC